MRTKYVTRTITKTNCTALCLNIETAEPHNVNFTFAGEITKEKDLIKMTQGKLPENDKAVAIVDFGFEKQLLGITEDEFLAIARPVTRTGANTAVEVEGGEN